MLHVKPNGYGIELVFGLFLPFFLKAMLEPMFQLENISACEEAWRRLNPTLHCGRDKMKLRVMGAGASQLKLDMGI